MSQRPGTPSGPSSNHALTNSNWGCISFLFVFGARISKAKFPKSVYLFCFSRNDHHIYIWDSKTGQRLLTLTANVADQLVAFLGATMVSWGNRLVSVSETSTALVWNVDSGACESTLHQPFPIAALTIVQNFVVLGGKDGEVCIWDGGVDGSENEGENEGENGSENGSENGADGHAHHTIYVQDRTTGELCNANQVPKPPLSLWDRLYKLATVAGDKLMVQTPRRTTLYTLRNGIPALVYNTQERISCHATVNDTVMMCGDNNIHIWRGDHYSLLPCDCRVLAMCALRNGMFALSVNQTVRLYTDCDYQVIDTSPHSVFSLVELDDGRLAGAVPGLPLVSIEVDGTPEDPTPVPACINLWDTTTLSCVGSIPYSADDVWKLQVVHSSLFVSGSASRVFE